MYGAYLHGNYISLNFESLGLRVLELDGNLRTQMIMESRFSQPQYLGLFYVMRTPF